MSEHTVGIAVVLVWSKNSNACYFPALTDLQYESLAVALCPLTFCGFQGKGRGHERACVRMLGRLEDALGGAVFDHLALAHDHDLIAEGTYHFEIMANE